MRRGTPKPIVTKGHHFERKKGESKTKTRGDVASLSPFPINPQICIHENSCSQQWRLGWLCKCSNCGLYFASKGKTAGENFRVRYFERSAAPWSLTILPDDHVKGGIFMKG